MLESNQSQRFSRPTPLFRRWGKFFCFVWRFSRGYWKIFCAQAWEFSDIFVFDALHSLYDNNIGDAGVKSIAEVLKTNTTLQKLE
jgi:hypothetical protein